MTKIVPGQKTVCYMEQFLNSFISTLIKKQLKQDAYIYEVGNSTCHRLLFRDNFNQKRTVIHFRLFMLMENVHLIW